MCSNRTSDARMNNRTPEGSFQGTAPLAPPGSGPQWSRPGSCTCSIGGSRSHPQNKLAGCYSQILPRYPAMLRCVLLAEVSLRL